MMIKNHKGTALLTAMLIVTLSASLVYFITARQQVATQQALFILNADKAYYHARGAETWAIQTLIAEKADNNPKPFFYPQLLEQADSANGEAQVSAILYDLQGRLNVNVFAPLSEDERISLRTSNETRHNNNAAYGRFTKFFKLVNPELNDEKINELITALQEWLMEFDSPFNRRYLEKSLPYRASGTPLLSTSELRLIDGFTAEITLAIAPFVTVLPIHEPAALNVNSADAIVLASSIPTLTFQEAEQLVTERQLLRGFENMDQFYNHPIIAAHINRAEGEEERDFTLESQYFLLETHVTMGKQQLTVYTALQRTIANNQPFVQVVWQSLNAL